MTMDNLPSPELLRKLLRYDHISGDLYWRLRCESRFATPSYASRWNKRYAGKLTFTALRKGYRCGRIGRRTYSAHRVIWSIFYGNHPDGQIDHINGRKDDNRIDNLRVVTDQENHRNKKMPITNKSGVIGVCWHKRCRRWRATIGVSGKLIELGMFREISDAAAARSQAEIDYNFHANHGRTK